MTTRRTGCYYCYCYYYNYHYYYYYYYYYNRELLEMKKVYTHPNYKYPSLYDDIAVVELGRRIVYDYEQEILFFFFLA